MPNSIFQVKRSISTTEELQKNVKVINPGIWVLVSAILFFLVGMVAFIFTTSYTSTIPVFSYSLDGTVYYYVKEENKDMVKVGMKVKYVDCDNIDTIAGRSLEPKTSSTAEFTDEVMQFGNYNEGDVLYEYYSHQTTTPDGYHQAYIQIENVRLIDSFFN